MKLLIAPTLRHVRQTPVLYPITACYIFGVISIVIAAAGWLPVGEVIIGFGFLCVLVLLAGTHHEVVVIHRQNEVLVARVEQLGDALLRAGVIVPDPAATKGSS